jgi:hypothetical protein
MIISKCGLCDQEKEYKYPSLVKRFCSHKCSNEWKWLEVRDKGVTATITCEHCQNDFTLLVSKKNAREKNGDIVKYCSRKCSGLASRKRKIVCCKNCGAEFETTRNEFCSKECVYEYKKKTGSTKRGGFWFENGYKVLNTEDGRGIKEHIKVMQDHIGRELKEDEVVHHINGDRLDNLLENLQLMTRGEHSRLHRLQELAEGKNLFGK